MYYLRRKKKKDKPLPLFEKAGVKLVTLTDYDHVVARALETGYIKPEDVDVIHEWRKDPANWGGK